MREGNVYATQDITNPLTQVLALCAKTHVKHAQLQRNAQHVSIIGFLRGISVFVHNLANSTTVQIRLVNNAIHHASNAQELQIFAHNAIRPKTESYWEIFALVSKIIPISTVNANRIFVIIAVQAVKI